jgi:hypothetical protein
VEETPEATPSPTPTSESSAVAFTPVIVPDTIDLTSSTESQTETVAETKIIESASSVISASIHEQPTASVLASVVEEIHSASSVVPSSSSSVISSSVVPSSSAIPPPAESHAPLPPKDADIPIASNADDLDDFYASLGLDDTLQEALKTESVADQSEATIVEDEDPEVVHAREAEKAAELAAKRAALLVRHVKWEDDIDAEIATQSAALRSKILEIRENAVKDLDDNKEIAAKEELFVSETEKYLKGIEIYFKNLKTENRKDEEKRGMWSKVVGKVDQKFKERLSEFQGFVHEWYVQVANAEIEEVGVSFLLVDSDN